MKLQKMVPSSSLKVASGSFPWHHLGVILGLTIVIAVGLGVRFAPYPAWKQHPERCFVDGEPLPTTFDAPYYMRLARDVVEGTYETRDTLRAVPDSPPRPRPVPLLSLLTAGIHQLSGVSIPWIALVLPAVLGAFSALCLYGPARTAMGHLGALIACAAFSLSPFLVHRTNLGRLDTDSLNVGLPLVAVGCFMAFARASRYAGLWLVGALVAIGLHAWWWDQSPQTPFLLAAVPFGVAVVLRYRAGDRKSLWIAVALVVALIAGISAFTGPSFFVEAGRRAWNQLTYMVIKQAPGDFPNIGLSISEQVRPTVGTFGRSVAGHVGVLWIAVFGVGWLFLRHPRVLLFFSPLVLLGFAGSFYAQRLSIFAAPFVGLGLGWIVDRLEHKIRVRHIAFLLALAAGVVLLIPAFRGSSKAMRWPSESAPVVQGITEAARRTPENAVLWAWWDHGYHIQYWGRRGTLADGEIHGGELVVPLAIPLAAPDENFAADFMIFFSTRGLSGMKKFFDVNGLSAAQGLAAVKAMLSAGPEACPQKAHELGLRHIPEENSWQAFFYPHPARPVFLFVDQLLLNTAYWWYWFATWDPAKKDGIHPLYRPVYPVSLWDDPSRRVPGAAGVHLQRGELYLDGRLVPLASLGLLGLDGTRHVFRYRSANGPHLDVHRAASLGVLMDGAPIGESLFHRLFFLNESPHTGRFRRIAQRPFVYQLWEVLPAQHAEVTRKLP